MTETVWLGRLIGIYTGFWSTRALEGSASPGRLPSWCGSVTAAGPLLSIRCCITETFAGCRLAPRSLRARCGTAHFYRALQGGVEKNRGFFSPLSLFFFFFQMCLQLPLCIFIVFLLTTKLTLEAKLNGWGFPHVNIRKLHLYKLRGFVKGAGATPTQINQDKVALCSTWP